MRETGYRIVSGYAEVRNQIAAQIKEGRIKLPFEWFYGMVGSKQWEIMSILKGKELVSFMVYSIEGKECEIGYLWHNPRLAVEYRKKSTVSPSHWLLELLVIKKGIKVFKTEKLTESSRKMLGKLIKEGAIAEKGLRRANPKGFRKLASMLTPTLHQFKVLKHPK